MIQSSRAFNVVLILGQTDGLEIRGGCICQELLLRVQVNEPESQACASCLHRQFYVASRQYWPELTSLDSTLPELAPEIAVPAEPAVSIHVVEDGPVVNGTIRIHEIVFVAGS